MALQVVFYLSKFFIELYNLYIIYSVNIHVKSVLLPSLSPTQRFPGVFKGGEEQARELNILEDWGREWLSSPFP